MRTKIILIALFVIANTSSAQTILGEFPRFNYLDFSENTSDVTLITYQLSRFDIIIDDTIKLKVIGHPSWGRCIIKNVPKGKHTFVLQPIRQFESLKTNGWVPVEDIETFIAKL